MQVELEDTLLRQRAGERILRGKRPAGADAASVGASACADAVASIRQGMPLRPCRPRNHCPCLCRRCAYNIHTCAYGGTACAALDRLSGGGGLVERLGHSEAAAARQLLGTMHWSVRELEAIVVGARATGV